MEEVKDSKMAAIATVRQRTFVSKSLENFRFKIIGTSSIGRATNQEQCLTLRSQHTPIGVLVTTAHLAHVSLPALIPGWIRLMTLQPLSSSCCTSDIHAEAVNMMCLSWHLLHQPQSSEHITKRIALASLLTYAHHGRQFTDGAQLIHNNLVDEAADMGRGIEHHRSSIVTAQRA